jgi:hypothetical protein
MNYGEFERSVYLVYIDQKNFQVLSVFSKNVNVRGTGRYRRCYYIYVSGKYRQIPARSTMLVTRAKEIYPEFFI